MPTITTSGPPAPIAFPRTGLTCPTIPSLGTILGLWSHPDDEAYLSAGLMALARHHGQRVVVVCATNGEAGPAGRHTDPSPGAATLRGRELAASLAALGVAEHQMLGFPDGSLADVDPASAVPRFVDAIRHVRPDTIVTFGPDGITGHPDHRAVSWWATAAWEAAGRPGRLWYATLSDNFHARWAALSDAAGVWMPGATPPCHRGDELAASIRCEGWVLERKLAALGAHASQTDDLRMRVGDETYAQWWAEEAFIEVAGPTEARSRQLLSWASMARRSNSL